MEGAEVSAKTMLQNATVAAEFKPPNLNGATPLNPVFNITAIDSNERLHVTNASQRSNTRRFWVNCKHGKRYRISTDKKITIMSFNSRK
jgi:hypothetical protein